MNTPSASPTGRSSLVRRFTRYAALLALGTFLALLAGEAILRLVPIPGISFHSFYYDPVTGGKYYPNTTLIYRSPDGVEVRRRANSWGFPDVEHELKPVPGTLRIGFFGDSYTDARQVRIEDTFFRVAEDKLNGRVGDVATRTNRRGEAVERVETISFGITGRSTLQCYLECAQWMEKSDLDVVVYVFVENDPGDQVRRMKDSDEVPFAVLSGDSFVVDYSFNEYHGHKTSWWHRAMQRIKSNSLVVSTLEGRLKLLLRHGVKRTVTEADRKGGAGGGGVPMVPSVWPPEVREEGWTLVERVLDRWRRDVNAQGRAFIIARVPREEVVAVPLETQDSWAPRLHRYCERNGVPLVDPTPWFLERMNTGEKMYYDHFTPEGHRAFADAIVACFDSTNVDL
jgi:hypothetical protein